MLVLLLACNNPCQQACVEMARYAGDCGAIPNVQVLLNLIRSRFLSTDTHAPRNQAADGTRRGGHDMGAPDPGSRCRAGQTRRIYCVTFAPASLGAPRTGAPWRASCPFRQLPILRCAEMPSNGPRRSVGTQCVLALCVASALTGCAAKYAQVPARLNLSPYGRVAVVTFSDDQSNTGMTTLATQRFAEALLASQSNVELLELGAADSSLKALATTNHSNNKARCLSAG